MPVVHVRALPQPEGADTSAVLAAVAHDLADLLGEPAERTWVTWETLEPQRYSEGSSAPETQPRSTHPPLVTVLAFEDKSRELVERMLECVADTIARELQLEDGNVFAVYEEARSGRVYSSGRVIH